MMFDLLMWPMLIPMILPLLYCIRYKKEALAEIAVIILSMILIVFLFYPISTYFVTKSDILAKFLLFIIIPIILLLLVKRNRSILNFRQYGIKKEGLKNSISLCVLFIPIMLGVTFVIKYINGISGTGDILFGTVSFFESFSEEFLFRGILFIFLLAKTNLKIAYVTSFFSFVLMHPYHIENLINFGNLFIISTIVQGILTIEIARRSGNITGAWLLHGANRFFSIVIIPLLVVE
jgi:membrane protease YdiL (CAAX protease family)